MNRKLEFKEYDGQGLLITFCGLDGCGKTSMIDMLAEKFRIYDMEVVLTKQPTDVVRESKIFRTYMDEENHEEFDYRALSLFAASDRVQHSNKYILPLLQEGKVVISDRYYYCCLANLCAREYEQDEWIYEIAHHIPKPDISFFLDIDVETALKRVRNRESELDKWIDIPLQYRLREEYINISKSNNGILINSKQSVQETFESVAMHIE